MSDADRCHGHLHQGVHLQDRQVHQGHLDPRRDDRHLDHRNRRLDDQHRDHQGDQDYRDDQNQDHQDDQHLDHQGREFLGQMDALVHRFRLVHDLMHWQVFDRSVHRRQDQQDGHPSVDDQYQAHRQSDRVAVELDDHYRVVAEWDDQKGQDEGVAVVEVSLGLLLEHLKIRLMQVRLVTQVLVQLAEQVLARPFQLGAQR